jgi:hypothetical protein
MQCTLCGNTPFDTGFFFITEGTKHSVTFCEKCFGKMLKDIKNKKIKI